MALLPALWAALLLLGSQSSMSSELVQATESTAQQNLSLESLQLKPGPIRLTGSQNEAILHFPVSSRQRISDMTLTLYVTNSISLVNRSQIAASINGSVVGQVAFKAETPETRVKMTIPAELIKNGYNKLTFSVAQHYSAKCEDPAAPELWSEIDTYRSSLSFQATPRAIEPLLSELPGLMDKRLTGNYTLTIVTPAPDALLIESGGLAAQAAALSRDYAPLTLRHALLDSAAITQGATLQQLADGLSAGNDVVLLGSRDELAAAMDKERYEQAAQPLLTLQAIGAQKERFLLLITGANHEQVRQAAAMLASAYATLPPSAHASIGEIAAIAAHRRPTLLSGVKQSFRDFGHATVTRQGIYPEDMVIRFWVPADRFAKPNSELNLHLHMAYGAGLGLQSTLDLFLNDHFEHAVRLAERQGAVYYDYRIPIPINSLAPGWNELHLRANLLPERDGGECQPTYTGNLLLTLFEDSYLEADEMGQLAQLPDLQLLGRTAFPFGGGRESRGVTLALSSYESGNLTAAWTLLAKLAQVNSAPLRDTRVATPQQARGNVLLVGQLQQLPAELRNVSSLSRNGWLRMRSEMQAAGNTTSPLALLPQAHAADEALMELSMGDLLKSGVIITQFESPHQGGNSVVMVVADQPEVLANGVERLINGSLWGQLAQGTAVLRNGSDKLLTYHPSSQFMVGSAGSQARLAMLFDKHPLLSVTAVLSGLLVFTLLTWSVLRRYRQRHHRHQEG